MSLSVSETPHAVDDLIGLSAAMDLSIQESNALYGRYVNRSLLRLYRMLGYDEIDIVRAEGAEIHLRDGGVLLDFSSALGVLALGHNHPRVLAAERECEDRRIIEALKVAPHKLQAALAHNLAKLLPDPLNISFFCCSGAEAVEAAMKLCEKAQPKSRRKFLVASGAYHGKTHGALALTRDRRLQQGFLLGLKPSDIIEIPFGDLQAARSVLRDGTGGSRGEEIIALVIEPIQGVGVNVPPDGYLRELTALCRDQGVYVIMDEVKTGVFRTGTFCAFERDGVVPDVVAISKALGGGKRAIAVTVASDRLFKKAYGRLKTCALHTTTFGGLGSSCAVAIETLNVMVEERLGEAARSKGEYLRSRLEEIRSRHPRVIQEIRGRGLMAGIKFDFRRGLSGIELPESVAELFRTAEAVFMTALARELLHRHGVVVHFIDAAPDVLPVMPPLIVTEGQIDRFCSALDSALTKGFLRMLPPVIGSVMGAERAPRG